MISLSFIVILFVIWVFVFTHSFLRQGIEAVLVGYLYVNAMMDDMSLRAGHGTIGYLYSYNPLYMYYKNLQTTAADDELLRNITRNEINIIDVDNLSGMMLMKIHFKREKLSEILGDTIMRRAASTYEMYTKLFNKGKLLLPDMYGYAGRDYEGLSNIDDATIELNELFYFNKCR